MFSRSTTRFVRNFAHKDTLIGCRLSTCTALRARTPTIEQQPLRFLHYITNFSANSIKKFGSEFREIPHCNLDDLFRVDSPEYDLEALTSWNPFFHVLEIMRSVIFNLKNLHEMGKCHGDLKPQNVLLFLGKYVSTRLYYTGSDTLGWKAPEQLLNGRQTIATDLFSLGCLLFFCITGGNHPFGQAIEQRDKNILENKMNLSQLENMPEASHLISLLLHPEPEMRPEASELCGHPLFWHMSRRINYLALVSSWVNKEVNKGNFSLFRELKSNAPEVVDPKWGDRLGQFGRLFECSSLEFYGDLLDCIGPRNSFKTRHYSRLLLRISPIICKYYQGEYEENWSGLSTYWSNSRFFPS